MKEKTKREISRREFLKDTAIAGGALCLGGGLLGMPSPAFAKKKEITFGTASPVGGYMLLATGIARCINEQVPGYNVTPVPEPRTSVGNVRAIHRKERELGLATASVVYNGFNGKKPFKEKQNIMSWFAGHFAIWNLLALESSGIKTVSDLKGKRVAVGTPRSTMDVLNKNLLLKSHGLSYGDFKPELVGLKEAISLMKDKHVDALSFIAAPPLAAISELSASRKVRFITADKGAMAKVIQEAPFYYEWAFPKNSYYPDLIAPDSIPVLAVNHVVMCSPALSDETMYQFTKAVFENIEIVHGIRRDYKIITLNRAPNGLVIPTHPGAIQYYKEKGVL